ncbi:hypothetical protein PF001_g29225 [Phytophthora fragariae]|uniref:Peroxisomal membrane protein PEX16 n=1 Tax=Phytophthora fragariae TaxID=53985 RepID=A0A6A4BDV5_9STRA|nr:hypothetical protein PF001_g29225 [Phytophthora fragariae]
MMKCFKSKTSSLLGAHEVWVGSHSGLARNLETTLYVAPQLVPKRVMEPEVATQLGYSLMGLLHLYHDYVVWKKESADKDPPTGSHKQTRLVRVPLSLISHVQVLAAVVARRVGGDVGKWRLSEGGCDSVSHADLDSRLAVAITQYKDVEYAPRPSAFARFKKPKQPGARTGRHQKRWLVLAESGKEMEYLQRG